MNIYENILRINELIKENSTHENFIQEGDLHVVPGVNISLVKEKNKKIGETNLIDMDNAYLNDHYLNNFLKNDSNNMNESNGDIVINNSNTLYVHDVNVDENFRGMGYGKKVMTKCHEVAKKMGYDNTCLIVQKQNTPAVSLYDGLGYLTIKEDDLRKLMLKKL
jgi:ribosomal protein S18 acetylase RimI-like enzyme